jgi:hypothetical protein
MSNRPPNSKGLMNWLGRQVGYVRKAIKTPATPEPLYQNRQVEEAVVPGNPGLKLRRTTIDEVIVENPTNESNNGDRI